MRFHVCAFAAVFSAAAFSVRGDDATSFKFNFGNGKAKPAWIQVSSTNSYSTASGYGFEPGANLIAGDKSVASTTPFYFSIKLPEGTYKVTAAFGGASGESIVTVKAELRRLMLEKVHVRPGKTETRSFVVNIRTPGIAGDGAVHLKPRERTNEWWDWDDKMTLEFNGSNPCLQTLQITPVRVPTVFLSGDSTVCASPSGHAKEHDECEADSKAKPLRLQCNETHASSADLPS